MPLRYLVATTDYYSADKQKRSINVVKVIKEHWWTKFCSHTKCELSTSRWSFGKYTAPCTRKFYVHHFVPASLHFDPSSVVKERRWVGVSRVRLSDGEPSHLDMIWRRCISVLTLGPDWPITPAVLLAPISTLQITLHLFFTITTSKSLVSAHFSWWEYAFTRRDEYYIYIIYHLRG